VFYYKIYLSFSKIFEPEFYDYVAEFIWSDRNQRAEKFSSLPLCNPSYTAA